MVDFLYSGANGDPASGTMHSVDPNAAVGMLMAPTTQPLDTLERTAAQLVYHTGILSDINLPNPDTRCYKLFREMRYDPTIAFARMIMTAPLVSAGWSYEEREGAVFGAKPIIEKYFEQWRVTIVKNALEGDIDFGWTPFEVVLHLDEYGYQVLKKVKPLLQTRTEILVDKDTGAFLGLRQIDDRQQPRDASGYVDLYKDNVECFNVCLNPEGTNWYGQALLKNIEQPYKQWNSVEDAAKRYDSKIAGSHIVVYYPLGTTPINGIETDNFEIAKNILNSMQSAGKIALPRKLIPFGDSVDKDAEDAWRIEIVSDKGNSASTFTDRQKYLDALKVRGLGLPERAVLEGQFGTKAEAEAHADFAIVNMELRHTLVVDEVQDIVDKILCLNWGPEAEGTIIVKANPISDSTKEYIKTLYTTLLANPDLLSLEYDKFDMDAVRAKLGVPTKHSEDEGLLVEEFQDLLVQQILAGGQIQTVHPDGTSVVDAAMAALDTPKLGEVATDVPPVMEEPT